MAELNITKKSIKELFSNLGESKFIIPQYQRGYSWDEEKCETLWNDLQDFFERTSTNENKKEEYFLGTIVIYKPQENDNKNEIEVIDGQQRIISLFLLLRAFYSQLEGIIPQDDNIKGLKRQISSCLWELDPRSELADFEKTHIESKVITETDNTLLEQILKKGKVDNQTSSSRYFQNYRFFQDKCDKYAQKNPTHWQDFIVSILKKVIIVPIECDDVDTALTIFSTLNDRGLPLADSDIFKSKIYGNQETEEAKEEFTKKWKDLNEKCQDSPISIDDLFRYYSHIIRAEKEDTSKEIALRKFYAGIDKKYEKLKQKKLIDDLLNLCDFWLTIYDLFDNKNSAWLGIKSRKYLHCLFHYPNDYWKYIVSVFYDKNKKEDNGFDKENNSLDDEKFSEFLEKITAFLFYKFIERPSVNHIKDDVYKNCVSIFNDNTLSLKVDKKFTEDKIREAYNYKIARGLLLLHSYQSVNQKELLPKKFDIEHIFPKKWQDTNYNGWEKKDAEDYLESLGNKMPIERNLNIQAGNNYFGQKKERYKNSNIQEVKEMSSYVKDDWTKEDIEKREDEMIKKIYAFFMENLENISQS